LMQTVVPALTRLNGHTTGPAHSPSTTLYAVSFLFTSGQDRLMRPASQAGFWLFAVVLEKVATITCRNNSHSSGLIEKLTRTTGNAE
jgi:hypothetical protein